MKINTTIMKELLTLLSKMDMVLEKSSNGEGQDESVMSIKRKIAEYASFSIANKRLDINTFFSAHVTHLMLSKYLDLVGSSLVDKNVLFRIKKSIDNYCTVVLKSVAPSIALNRVYDMVMDNGSFDVSIINDITKILNDAQEGNFKNVPAQPTIIEEEKVEEIVVKEEFPSNSDIVDKTVETTNTVVINGEYRHPMENKAFTHTVPPITRGTDCLDTVGEGNDIIPDEQTIKHKPGSKSVDFSDRKVITPIVDSNMSDDEFFKHGIRKIIKAILEYVPCAPTGEEDVTMIADGLYVNKIVTYSEPKFTQPTLDKIKALIRDEKLSPENVIDLSTMVSMYVKKINNTVFTEQDLTLLKDRTFEAMALVY